MDLDQRWSTRPTFWGTCVSSCLDLHHFDKFKTSVWTYTCDIYIPGNPFKLFLLIIGILYGFCESVFWPTFWGSVFQRGGFSAQKNTYFSDQIKKIKCPGNVFRVHIYINTALDMFKKDDVGSHSLPKRDLHFGGQVPVQN